MKTNVPIELDEGQLIKLATVIAGKPVKRTASRKEIIAICQQHIAGLIGTEGATSGPESAERKPAGPSIYDIDPGDERLMARPQDPGYVRGWNLVKRGGR